MHTPWRRRAGTVVLLGLAAAGCIAGCTPTSGTESLSEGTDTTAAPEAEFFDNAALQAELTDGLDEIAEEMESSISVALYTEGGRYAYGPSDVGQAWSTIKVPIAIAALRSNAELEIYAEPAITWSDNWASEVLWRSLGATVDSATAVQEVIAESGDETIITTPRLLDGTLGWGEIQWPLANQAQFAYGLQCMSGAEPVISLMGEITDEQSYGLGIIDDVYFKGGWGPDPEDQFTARQLGFLSAQGGTLGIAISATPDDGLYESATEVLTAVAELIEDHRPEVLGESCQPLDGEELSLAESGSSTGALSSTALTTTAGATSTPTAPARASSSSAAE